jgi:hypothetical protein
MIENVVLLGSLLQEQIFALMDSDFVHTILDLYKTTSNKKVLQILLYLLFQLARVVFVFQCSMW